MLFIYYAPLCYYTCINISRIFHPGRNSYLRVPKNLGYLNWRAARESEEVNGSNDLLTHHSLLCARLLFKGLLCQLNPLHIRRVQVLAADAKVILESPSCRFFGAHPLVAAPFPPRISVIRSRTFIKLCPTAFSSMERNRPEALLT